MSMKKRLLFIFNPRSGKGKIKENLADILDIMVKAGYEVTVHTTQSQGDATRKAREEAANYDRIVCSGGDGTLDEVVTGVMSSGYDVSVGYIPAGSTNDFGNSLGIDKNMVHAADIAANGKPFACDVGKFNQDYFVYVAAFGLFTEVSYQTSQDLKNMLGHAAYILEGIKQIWDIPSYHMQVEYDGNVLYDEFIYGMVTNSMSVGGFKGIIPGNIGLNDGVFEVTLVKSPKNPIELNDILGYLTGLIKDSDMVYSFQTSQIRLTSSEKVSWTLDGEYGGDHTQVTVEDHHKALEIIVE
ncbi:MAG: YegS/Rv2252/BmrU family lipid kinase [Lachnospiraceae bacterium]|nr:YegS/Rv2252/BmrU family lipid kinase [Lachnospiraceae bacterium]MDD6192858.1 YegS/Rv2252/BmrU family lipid kinase [Lachnospiraceae bacterium]MDY4792961.1 YegS/Rv2252/BmrU family lipid kinase [Pararoseburia sp.]